MEVQNMLTARERKFCNGFLNTGNVCEAARRAGYVRNPEEQGESLLCREDIAGEIEKLSVKREKTLANMAMVGYQRLAFGNISDAVSLLYMEDPSKEDLSGMDLFMISEIKRPKDGSMEIKFFDRLKALEKLESRVEDNNSMSSIFDAISEGARAARGDAAGN
jgi:hypothetical protein